MPSIQFALVAFQLLLHPVVEEVHDRCLMTHRRTK